MRRRPWRGWDDLAPMQDLLARGLPNPPERAFLHPGDLAWWVGWPPQTPDELADRVTIVEDDGAIVGWQYLEREEVNQWVDTPGADPQAADPEAVWHELEVAIEARPELGRSTREDDADGVARFRAAGFEPM